MVLLVILVGGPGCLEQATSTSFYLVPIFKPLASLVMSCVIDIPIPAYTNTIWSACNAINTSARNNNPQAALGLGLIYPIIHRLIGPLADILLGQIDCTLLMLLSLM